MKALLLSIGIGILAGVIDILPMIIKKMNMHAITSAFAQYFFVAIVILNIDLPNITWWLEGSVISFCLAIPIMILVSASDKKSIPIIASMSVVLGFLISLAEYVVF